MVLIRPIVVGLGTAGILSAAGVCWGQTVEEAAAWLDSMNQEIMQTCGNYPRWFGQKKWKACADPIIQRWAQALVEWLERREAQYRQAAEAQRAAAQRACEALRAAEHRAEKQRAVAACIVIVRNEADARRRFTRSDFNAYVTSDGSATWFGTPDENFLFEKCMAEKGYPVK